MSGKNSGVAARIQEDCKQAVYVHRYAHKLNLVLVDVANSVTEAGYFFSLLQKLYVFISGSYVRNKWKIVQKEMYPTELQLSFRDLVILAELADTILVMPFFAVSQQSYESSMKS